ncbi:hypothetical protein [Janthinobacterium sp.]|uniref:hypothetical protein n=1 Tax=Janthinobacterium sp. TaxID=1871054 RepID=UPI00293D7A34|nr:hypothetical protein [Janthinobacterium sp.]
MRDWNTVTLAAMLCGACGGSAAAPAEAACVEVEVNGERGAPSFACLTEKLQPAAARKDGRAAPEAAAEALAKRPPNQLGLYNRAATSVRMGNAFGNSVYPQRPPASR